MSLPEVAMDPGSVFFFRTRSQKFVANRIRSHFSISAEAGVCVVIS